MKMITKMFFLRLSCESTTLFMKKKKKEKNDLTSSGLNPRMNTNKDYASQQLFSNETCKYSFSIVYVEPKKNKIRTETSSCADINFCARFIYMQVLLENI